MSKASAFYVSVGGLGAMALPEFNETGDLLAEIEKMNAEVLEYLQQPAHAVQPAEAA